MEHGEYDELEHDGCDELGHGEHDEHEESAHDQYDECIAWLSANRPVTAKIKSLQALALNVVMSNELIDFKKTEDIPVSQIIPRSILTKKILNRPYKFMKKNPANGLEVIANLINTAYINPEQMIDLIEKLYDPEEPEESSKFLAMISDSNPLKGFAIKITTDPMFALRNGLNSLFEKVVSNLTESKIISIQNLSQQQKIKVCTFIGHCPLILMLVESESYRPLLNMLLVRPSQETGNDEYEYWSEARGSARVDMARIIILAYFRSPRVINDDNNNTITD